MNDDKISDSLINDESNSFQNNADLPIVLLIEDDVINASVIEKFIRRNYKVDVAFTSAQSIEMTAANKYSVILLDINLGRGMNGIEVLKEIKKSLNNANTPVIASTAYSMIGDKEKLLQAGFDEYISKPFSMNEILVMIKRVIDKLNK